MVNSTIGANPAATPGRAIVQAIPISRQTTAVTGIQLVRGCDGPAVGAVGMSSWCMDFGPVLNTGL